MPSGDSVVVPGAPGPLIWPRQRDGLDDAIDDLLPDVDQGPGWFDAALVGGGMGAVLWEVAASPPPFVAALGVGAVALGTLLPLRWAWRRLRPRLRLRRPQPGLALALGDPATDRLVAAYEQLAGPPEAVAAAHRAVVEVATLLAGRTPATERERAYVVHRASAIEELATALRPGSTPADALVEAREELDALSDVGTVAHIERLALEARLRAGQGGLDGPEPRRGKPPATE